jgi:hypothetical protein
MTFAQWLFHYAEVIRAEKEEHERFEILLSYLELVGTMANPEAGKKLKELKDQQKFSKELNADNFASTFEELKKFIPAQIEIKAEGAGDKFILPKFSKEEHKKSRKLGISKGGETDDNE